MTSIEELKQKLNIEIGDRDINPGMCKPMKNRYYNINNIMLVVEFKNNKYAVFSNDIRTRELLSERVWCIDHGYARNGTVGYFQCNYLNYAEGLVADHINMLRYDNRAGNLRVVTHQMNMRNKTKPKNKTTPKQGVRYNNKGNFDYWVASISGIEGNYIQKHFSIKQLGYEQAKQQAIIWRLEKEREFGYTGE